MHTYLISDTHFFHSSIIKSCNRPFNSIEEMNEVIVSNWNKTVTSWDTIYHLGDIALKGSALEQKTILKRLNGNKILVKGNHDSRSNTFYQDAGFIDIHKHLILPYKDYTFLLTHIPNHKEYHSINPNWTPIEVEGNKVVNILGHLHNTFYTSSLDKSKYYCVSVENINYTPIHIERVYNIMRYNNRELEDIRAGINISRLSNNQFKELFGFDKCST